MTSSTARAEMEAFCRSQCQTAYLGNGIILCRVLGKYLLFADAKDTGIVPHFCLNGFWESWVTLAVTDLLRPGWNCIDVGANHGYYSLIMAGAVGATGRVLSIEPNPQLVPLLQRNLSVNGFQRYAKVLQAAAWDSNFDSVNLVLPQGRALNANIFQHSTKADTVFEVETVTIDELTRDWPTVDFVKIDAEGAERAILRGMVEVLKKNRHIIVIMEFNCARYANPETFLQDIQDAGFPLRYIDYDSQIKDLTVEQCLTDRPEEDRMLFLQRDTP